MAYQTANHSNDRTRYVVGAVDAALNVLEVVSRQAGLSLVDVANRAELNKSRAMRLLVTLELRGLVRKDAVGNFHLASKAMVLGDRAQRQMDHLQLLQPILDQLRDATSESVQYRVLDGLETICVAKADSHMDISVQTSLGRPRELYVGSSKSILAFADTTLQEKVLASQRHQFTENTLVDTAALRRQLAEIRENGYSVSRGERIEGALALGAPVHNADGAVTSCISLLGPEFRMGGKIDKLAAELLKAAEVARQTLSM